MSIQIDTDLLKRVIKADLANLCGAACYTQRILCEVEGPAGDIVQVQLVMTREDENFIPVTAITALPVVIEDNEEGES